MPKFAQEQVARRDQVPADTQQQYTTQVVSHPVASAVTPAESDLMRLSSALNQFMPAANKYLESQADQEHQEEETLGFKSAKEGGEPPSQAATPWFQHGYIKGNWENHAIQASEEAWKEYQLNKDNPDFNLQDFLQKKVQTDLNGVSNPTAVATYMQRFGAMSANLQKDLVQHQTDLVMKQRREDTNVALSDLVQRHVDSDGPMGIKTPGELMSSFQSLGDEKAMLGITRPEMAAALLDTITAKSKALNGRTDLFDIFYEKDPKTGKSLVDMNPKLAEQVENAKYKAQALFDHHMTRENYSQNQSIMADINRRLQQEPETLTDEYLKDLTPPYLPFGQFGGYGHQYANIIAQRNAALQGQQDMKATLADISAGNGWKYKDTVVKQALTATLNPDIQALSAALNDPNALSLDRTGKPASAAGIALNNIVTAVTRTGSDVIPDQLSNLAGSVKLMAPANDKDATVPAKFSNLHQLYSSLSSSSNPGLVDRVFDKDSKQIMESYDYLVKHEAVSPTAAWRKAFWLNSPEGLEYMEKRLATPEGQKLIADAVAGGASGWGSTDTSNLPNWMRQDGSHWWSVGPLADGTYPKNYDSVLAPALKEARRITMSHEGISNQELQDKLGKWFKSNYIHDETTNRLVQVQEGTASTSLVKAFSDMSADYRKTYGSDAVIEYRNNGNGRYSVVVGDKDRNTLKIEYPDLSQQQIVDHLKFKTQFTEPERKQFFELDTKARQGTLTVEDMNNNKDVIDKARRAGLMTPEMVGRTAQLQYSAGQAVSTLGQQLVAQGNTSTTNINTSISRIPDLAAKRPVAQMMMSQGEHAGALTVMGEGVALKAYADPAKGTNIGVGYNIDANAASAPEDFRKAGIQFSVDDIKAGKYSITPEQAIRLYQVVKPRYEVMAQKAFDERHSEGAFAKLSNPEKAVLTDIAYQSGGNVKNFTTLFDYMMTKNPDTNLKDALRLTYKDRNTGEQVVDEHRRNLRLSMLLGRFDGSLRHAGYIQ